MEHFINNRVRIVPREQLDQITLDAYVSTLLFYPEFAGMEGIIASITEDGRRDILNVILDNGERVTDYEECFVAID